MFISPARSKLNSSTFEYTAASITVTFQPSVDIVLLSENIAACLSGGGFNSIPEAKYSLTANTVVPLKSSVCSLLEAARIGLKGSCPWLGHAKTGLCLEVQQDCAEHAEGIDLDALSRAISGSSVT